MSDRRLATDLLLEAGRLLLAYNESTAAIHRTLATTAAALTDEICHIGVFYRGVTVALAGESPAVRGIEELRYNMAVQARVHQVLDDVRAGRLDPPVALA